MLEQVVAVLLGGGLLLAWYMIGKQVRERWRSTPRPTEEIPGWLDPPADPELGDLGEALSRGSLHEYLSEQHQGGQRPIRAFWWKEMQVVSVCSPRAFKETENLHLKPEKILGPMSAVIHGHDGIQDVSGPLWEHKKKCLYGSLRGKHLEVFVEDFVRVAEATATRWEEDGKIELQQSMFELTLSGILATSLGSFKDQPQLGGNALKQLIFLYDFCKKIAEKKMIDPTPPDEDQLRSFETHCQTLRDCLKKRILSRKSEEKKTEEFPLLDAIIASGASEHEMVSDMLTFLGGFHTSGFFCMWLFLYLAKYPLVQDKLVEEIHDRVGDDRGERLKAYVLKSNSYLRQVLDEVMRVNVVAPVSGHKTPEEMVVEGYHIPANTSIIHAIGVAMLNPDLWGESPRAFRPENFAPGSRHAKRGHEFRPFGVSCPRRCPANLFTYAMVSTYVTVLIRHLVVSAPECGEVERKHSIATSPRGTVRLTVTPRNR